MNAMILAAGYGSRLRPVTDTIPKALVSVGQLTMLEIVARRLIDAGTKRLVVNVHHHADQVESLIRRQKEFGVETVISDERDALLDTGGGLAHARRLLTGSDPFLLHNVDVYSDIDLCRLLESHRSANSLATLVVNNRPSSRYLMFDDHGLTGHGSDLTGIVERARPNIGLERRYAFCGIHAISSRIFDLITERGAFSIVTLYTRLAAMGQNIVPLVARDDELWIDVGAPERLEQARRIAASRPQSS